MLEQVLAYMGSMNRILAGGNALKAWGLTRSVNGAVRIVQRRVLLDHLVRPVEHRLRNRQANRFRGFEIYPQLKLARLLNRQVSRLGSLEDFIYIDGDAPVAVGEVRRIGHEPTGIYSFSSAVYRR